MPLYDIQHSFPLSLQQKTSLAEAITKLHATTFHTPSLFVNVKYSSADASDNDFFVAGKPKHDGRNLILALVRTSETRTKESWDKLAEKLEALWMETVSPGEAESAGADEKKKGAKGGGGGAMEEKESDRQAKKLNAIFIYPMLAARELGFVIPKAGEEGPWLKSNTPEFHHRATAKGDQDFVDLLEEMEKRDDLKEMVK